MSAMVSIISIIAFFGTILILVGMITKTSRAKLDLERKRLEIRERELALDEQKIRFLRDEDDRLLKESRQTSPTKQDQ